MFPPYPINKNNVLKRIFNRIWEDFSPIDPYIGQIIPAFIKGLLIIKKYNINTVLVSVPPFSSLIIGYLLSKVTGVKFVADYQDPWTLHKREKYNFNKKLNSLCEKIIIKSSNIIVLNTMYAKNAYLEKFNKLNIVGKTFVIPNAYQENKIQALPFSPGKKVILYAGNFYGKRKLLYLVNPIIRLIHEKKMTMNEIEIHVFGKIKEDDFKAFKVSGLQKIVIQHDYTSYSKILRYMKSADILYLPQGDEVKYAISYKFYDYLSVQRPIVSVTSLDSATAEIMREIDCGEIAELFNDDSVYEAIKKILIEKKEYSFSGKQNYTWEVISKKYLELLKS